MVVPLLALPETTIALPQIFEIRVSSCGVFIWVRPLPNHPSPVHDVFLPKQTQRALTTLSTEYNQHASFYNNRPNSQRSPLALLIKNNLKPLDTDSQHHYYSLVRPETQVKTLRGS